MSVLDLQGMETPEKAKKPAGSRISNGCTVSSNVSLLLCILVL